MLNEHVRYALSEQRKTQIDEILAVDKTAYDKWFRHARPRRLDIPKSALRHWMISNRILELSLNPQNVDLVLATPEKRSLRAVVVEHMGRPVTDLTELEKYRNDAQSLSLLPESIDELFYINYPLVLGKLLDLRINDRGIYELLLLGIERPKVNQLHIGRFWVDRFFQRKGIGTCFYSGIHQAAIDLRYDYIVGANSEINIDFFAEKLDRARLREINPRDRSIFWNHPISDQQLNYLTIDFLHPHDKQRFLMK